MYSSGRLIVGIFISRYWRDILVCETGEILHVKTVGFSLYLYAWIFDLLRSEFILVGKSNSIGEGEINLGGKILMIKINFVKIFFGERDGRMAV